MITLKQLVAPKCSDAPALRTSIPHPNDGFEKDGAFIQMYDQVLDLLKTALANYTIFANRLDSSSVEQPSEHEMFRNST